MYVCLYSVCKELCLIMAPSMDLRDFISKIEVTKTLCGISFLFTFLKSASKIMNVHTFLIFRPSQKNCTRISCYLLWDASKKDMPFLDMNFFPSRIDPIHGRRSTIFRNGLRNMFLAFFEKYLCIISKTYRNFVIHRILASLDQPTFYYIKLAGK